jgi:hypothetical protein
LRTCGTFWALGPIFLFIGPNGFKVYINGGPFIVIILRPFILGLGPNVFGSLN